MRFGGRALRRGADGEWHPAGDGLLSAMLARGGADLRDITAAEAVLGVRLPPTLRAFIESVDAAEGFIRGNYLAMWPVAALADLNTKAKVSRFAPDLVFFGTDGGGEGFAFERESDAFVNVPMIGMGFLPRTAVGASFDAFLRWLADTAPVEGKQSQPDRARLGQVIFEKTPIIVGGSPTDPANKALVPLRQYAELVGWWNERLPSSGPTSFPSSSSPASGS
jgi:hypothetical protein